jgi:hypothetical protein
MSEHLTVAQLVTFVFRFYAIEGLQLNWLLAESALLTSTVGQDFTQTDLYYNTSC